MTRDVENRAKAGFTLVEIMIVVGIIGLLCAIAIPSFTKSRQTSRINRMMNDLRIVYDAINMYAMEYGDYPAGFAQGASTPTPVAEYLSGAKWTSPTALGGGWWYFSFLRWDPASSSLKRCVLVLVDNVNFGGVGIPTAAAGDWLKIDNQLDDGNLSRGRFKFIGGQMQYSVDDVAW